MEEISNFLARPENLVIAGAGCYIVGFVLREQIYLRILVLVGTFFYLWYYFAVAEEPLWEAIIMTVMIGISNVIGFFNFLISRSVRFISRAEMPIYQKIGCTLPGDFRKLMRLGTRHMLPSGTIMTREGEPPDRLYFLLAGNVVVEKGGRQFNLKPDAFIGEVSMIKRSTASATVVTASEAEVIEWDQKNLRAAMEANDTFRVSIEAMISRDMAEKVAVGVLP